MRTINAFYYNITSSQTSHTAVYGLEGERVEGLLYSVPTCILGLMYTCVCVCLCFTINFQLSSSTDAFFPALPTR